MTTVDKSTKLYSTFDPRSIPNCVLWLDAADSTKVSLSGSNVTQWNDKSGNGYSVSQANASFQPTLTSSAQNGLSGIQFSTSTFLFTLATNMPKFTTGSATSFFVAARNASANSGWNLISTIWLNSSALTGTARYHFSFNQGSTPGPTLFANSALVGQVTTNVISPSANAIIGFTASSTSATININGSSSSYSGVTLPDATGTTVFLLGDSRNSSSFSSNIMIFEVLGFNIQLTSTQREQIEGYLAWKWGIQGSLAGGHPYITRNPNLSTFRPTDISNCALWLDAIDASTITGTSNVTQWNDKSGNGRNFTATTGPAYSSNTMTFNGSTQRLGNTAWNNFSRINHTLIAVHKPDTNSAYVGNTRLISIQQTAGTPYVVFPYLNNTTPNGYINDGNASTNPAASGKTLLDNSSTSAYNIITASISGSAQVIYNNGSVQDTQAYTITSDTITTGVNIGNQYAEWYKGSVKEIIIYTSALNVTDVNRIEGYLAWKWGLQGSLPSTHPFKTFYPLKIN